MFLKRGNINGWFYHCLLSNSFLTKRLLPASLLQTNTHQNMVWKISLRIFSLGNKRIYHLDFQGGHVPVSSHIQWKNDPSMRLCHQVTVSHNFNFNIWSCTRTCHGFLANKVLGPGNMGSIAGYFMLG